MHPADYLLLGFLLFVLLITMGVIPDPHLFQIQIAGLPPYTVTLTVGLAAWAFLRALRKIED